MQINMGYENKPVSKAIKSISPIFNNVMHKPARKAVSNYHQAQAIRNAALKTSQRNAVKSPAGRGTIARAKPIARANPIARPVAPPVVHPAVAKPYHPITSAHTAPAKPPVVTKVPPVAVKPPVKPPVAPAAPAAKPTDGLADVNKVYDQRKIAELAQLKASQDKALGLVNQQKAETNASYYGQRNQADVVGQQNVQRLKEVMANSGLGASGENISANVALNNERQGSLNSLNLQEQQKMNEYSNQITDINDPAKQQAIIANIESERSKALVDAQNTAQERAWRQYTFNNMSAADKAQLAWAKQQFGEDKAWQMYQLKYNGEIQKSTNQAQIDAYAP